MFLIIRIVDKLTTTITMQPFLNHEDRVAFTRSEKKITQSLTRTWPKAPRKKGVCRNTKEK